jgi:hypothetical protein
MSGAAMDIRSRRLGLVTISRLARHARRDARMPRRYACFAR